MKLITIRQQVQEQLEKEIRSSYDAGQLIPGERPLAKRFGVSVVTVRQALQGLVELGLIERKQGVGTVVLSRNGKIRRLPVGILVEIDVTHPDTSPFYLNVAINLQRELERRGHATRLFFGTLQPGEHSETLTCKELITAYEERSIKALAVISWTTPAWRIAFESVGIPIIRFGNDCPHGVRTDGHDFILHATEDLIAHGRRRIGLITWGGLSHLHYTQTQYIKLYLEKEGLEVNSRRFFSDATPGNPGAGWDGMREIWRHRSDRPDGLIVADEVLLKGVLLAATELRIEIPKDLMVCVFTALPSTHWGRATVSEFGPDMSQLVTLATDMLEHRLSDPLAEGQLRSVPIRRQTASAFPSPSTATPFLEPHA